MHVEPLGARGVFTKGLNILLASYLYGFDG